MKMSNFNFYSEITSGKGFGFNVLQNPSMLLGQPLSLSTETFPPLTSMLFLCQLNHFGVGSLCVLDHYIADPVKSCSGRAPLIFNYNLLVLQRLCHVVTRAHSITVPPPYLTVVISWFPDSHSVFQTNPIWRVSFWKHQSYSHRTKAHRSS
ncbi:hypothetical protein XENOCAPTIV_020797 [Xenoophorus captivus]|uniref:Uncharacterized protein n=1 Tax=Xenoophorus captivus TaxID=1517983 RepID=A0ABV0QNL4_9TELE